MLYKAKTQQWIHFLLAVLPLSLIVSVPDSFYLRAACLAVMAMNFFAIFIKFEFVIGADTVTFRTYLFQWKLYEKRVVKNSIKQVVFKRGGWMTKSAVIKVQQGFPLRLVSFMPDTLFEDLIAFCEANTIPYNKTKDFRILEKVS